jgi:ATP-dependent Zn protease
VAKKEIERTAYHQAGHAVVAAHLGFPIETVSITPGRCTHRSAAWLQRTPKELVLDTLASWARTHNQAVVFLAGGLAATIFDPAAPPETDRGDDFASATDLMLALAAEGMERQALKAYLRCRTENVVQRCWKAIQTTAAGLLQHGTISGEELSRVLLLARVPSAFSEEDRQWLPDDPTEVARLLLASDANYLDAFWQYVSDRLDRPWSRPMAG